MSATSRRSAASSELRDWRVWAIAGGTTVAVVHGLLQRLGWRAALLLLPLAGLAAVSAWMWLRRRPSGFAAEATRALAAHLPDGRPPRVGTARQDGHVWEVEWRLADRVAGSALLKRTRDLEHQLGAALHLRFDRDRLRLRAGTAEIPDLVAYQDFYRHQEPEGELVVGIGESRWGPVWTDLVKLPHVLIGGTTNFGKSVMVCQLLTRLALRYPPEHVKFALVDFKRVELNLFEGLPHVTPPGGQAASLAVAKDLASYLELLRVLSESLDERKLRFDLAGGVKNIQAWNRRPELGGRLPYVLLVIDELAELSVEEAADAEEKRRRQEALALLSWMARLGRALGFHIIAATQRPAVDTVPGPIKSQLLARCCFKVASGTESRVVLGEDNSAGAELPAHPGRGIWQWSEPVVFQGPLLKPEDAEAMLARLAGPNLPELDANGDTASERDSTAIPAEPLGEGDLATPFPNGGTST
ncbi:MAG TPA: FtsK/SpoIIIE domain-containing protein [Candidatus Eisenbacteria bacterium]|nr:FtsK/SpoIIIE domain-containing protein [Candidatus Eisenbacteria bacterium]